MRSQIEATNTDLTYSQFLTWRGFLEREPPRRPEPDRPAGPPSLRTNAWKYGLVGSRDENGFVHLPPSRVSMGSGEIDQMEQVRMADVPATIATFTVDRLAFSLSPPVVAAIIDFDGGGRFQCELTDVDPATVRIGDRVADDVPAAVHHRRHPQLLLEGEAAHRGEPPGPHEQVVGTVRSNARNGASHGITRDPRQGRHRRDGLHQLR